MSNFKSQKLAYLCSSVSWGGLEMNQLKNAIWMKQRGHSVVVITLQNTPFHEAAIKNDLDVLLIERHRKYLDFGKAFCLAKLIKQHAISKSCFCSGVNSVICFLYL